jgi:hypothetical protein
VIQLGVRVNPSVENYNVCAKKIFSVRIATKLVPAVNCRVRAMVHAAWICLKICCVRVVRTLRAKIVLFRVPVTIRILLHVLAMVNAWKRMEQPFANVVVLGNPMTVLVHQCLHVLGMEHVILTAAVNVWTNRLLLAKVHRKYILRVRHVKDV